MSFSSCYKYDGTSSESPPLPTLPSQLCPTRTLSRFLLPTTPKVALFTSLRSKVLLKTPAEKYVLVTSSEPIDPE